MSSNIPEEICYEILLKVSVKTLLACKCACKTWFTLISSPDFVRMHLDLTIQRNKPNLLLHGNDEILYTISHDSLELYLSTDRFLDYAVETDYPSFGNYSDLVGCCDGLVCLWFFNTDESAGFRLWNPATREYKELPIIISNYPCIVAFGYDKKSNDYKLLAGFEGSFKVYSLRTDSWQTIENIPYEFDCNRKSSGVLVNGYFHWLAERKNSEDTDDVVVSLDINSEIFKEIELPKEVLENGALAFHNLGVLKGCLCVILSDFTVGVVEVWVMKNYGVPESWTKRHTVNARIVRNDYFRLTWSFKSGEILFAGYFAGLVLYFPEDDTIRKSDISSLPSFSLDECYFESLVSLKSGNYYVREEQIEESMVNIRSPREQPACDLLVSPTVEETLLLRGTLVGHIDMVTAIASPVDNSNMIVSSSRDESIIVWTLNKQEGNYGVPKHRLTGHGHYVQDVVLSSDAKFAISGSWDGELRLWDLNTGLTTRRFVGHTEDVLSVAFSVDRQIVSASRDHSIKLWNILGECKYTIEGGESHTSWVSCVRFIPNALQPTVVSASWDNTVKVWNLNNRRLRNTLAGHGGYVNTIAISPDGSLCASGGKDGVVLLWDLADEGNKLYSLDAASGVIHALCFSPNRYWLCVATEKGGVKIWNHESKNLVQDLKVEPEPGKNKTFYCSSLNWSSDGSTLFTGYTDGTIRVWGFGDST